MSCRNYHERDWRRGRSEYRCPTNMIHRMLLMLAACLMFIPILTSTEVSSSPVGKLMIKKEAFGTTHDGEAVDLFTLTNAHGMEVRAMTYGGIIVALRVPDRNGQL